MEIQPVQIQTPDLVGAYARGLQTRHAMRQMQDEERTRAAQEALRALFSRPGFDATKPEGMREVMSLDPAMGMQLRKQQAEIAKSQAESDYKRWQGLNEETKLKATAAQIAHSQYEQADPQTRDTPQAKQLFMENGLKGVGITIPQWGDIDQHWQASMGMAQFAARAKALEAEMTKRAELPYEQQREAYKAGLDYRNSVDLAGVQHGYRVGEENIRSANDLALESWKQQNPSAPSGYRPNGMGGVSFIPGGPADPAVITERQRIETANKPLTEDQGRATGFLSEALLAHDKMEKMMASGYDPTSASHAAYDAAANLKIPFTDARPLAAMGARDNDTEVFQSAGKAFIGPVVYGKSGATVTPQEWETAKDIYFPQAGDSKEKIALKKALREQALKALEIRSGKGAQMAGVSGGATAGNSGSQQFQIGQVIPTRKGVNVRVTGFLPDGRPTVEPVQ